MKIETPVEYMESLQWNKEKLQIAIKFLHEWEKRDDSFYNKYTKISKNFDLAERQHYKNCVNFWTNRLNNETQSPRNT